jgi:phosphoglycolate phosphatase
MRKYDLVIFDFDGTLADTFPWFASVLNSAADRFGFNRVAPEDEETLRGYEPQGVLSHLGLPRWKLPLVARHMRKLMTEQLPSISLFDGAVELLASLSSRGVTLVLMTSNSEKNVRQLLGPRGAACFQQFVCGTSMFGKARKIKKLLARTRFPAKRALLIGDEIRDCQAAHASGVAFGAVSWGYNTAAALRAHQPTEFFATMSDIQRLFEAGSSRA